MGYQAICALGDSITNGYWDEDGLGWFGRLSTKIVKKYPYRFGFNNLAMSGDNAGHVLQRLRMEVPARDPDILLIAVGVNDLIRWHSKDQLTDVLPEVRQQNWQAILAEASAMTKRVMVLGILPIDESRMPEIGALGPYYNLNQDIEAYNTDLAAWCSAAGVTFFAQYEDAAALDWLSYLHDASHPNAKGHEWLAGRVMQKLEELKWLE